MNLPAICPVQYGKSSSFGRKCEGDRTGYPSESFCLAQAPQICSLAAPHLYDSGASLGQAAEMRNKKCRIPGSPLKVYGNEK